ncbi:MAG: hypothetical protein MPJ82_06810, partial [Alphaproteobacteria bacterium]|nr:hypothetical protein [Alphaproteobacteria bacterium]
MTSHSAAVVVRPLIKETGDGRRAGSIGDKPSALVGVNFRLLQWRLKRAAPTVACGRRPQKIKWTDNGRLVRLSIVCLLN